MRHGEQREASEPLGPERLVCQEGPFSDFTLLGAYHYGKLATGPHAGLWVRLGASPVDMGLIRSG